MKITLSSLYTVVLATTFSASLGFAQETTAPQCKSIIQPLSKGAFPARNVGWEGKIDQCGHDGAAAIATAFRATKQAPLSALKDMQALQTAALLVRDPNVLAATRAVVTDPTASLLARAASLTVLLITYDVGARLPGTLEEQAKGEVTCSQIEFAGNRIPARIIRDLPSNAPEQIAASIDQVVRDKNADPSLRSLARCVREFMYHKVPPNLPRSSVTIQHVCGSSFKFINNVEESLPVNWVKIVVGNNPPRSLGLAPRESVILELPKGNQVKVTANGKVLAEIDYPNVECTAPVDTTGHLHLPSKA